MKRESRMQCLAVLLLLSVLTLPMSGTATFDENPLDKFDWMIGGKWQNADTVQEYEWGLDKKWVKARSYLISGKTKTLVSEGVWFWHPGEKKIKGYFSAKGMPFDFIESEAEFEGTKLVHRLKTYSNGRGPQVYVEVMKPVGDGSFAWELFAGSSVGGRALMNNTFRKL